MLLFLIACRDYADLCATDDPSVDALMCWNQGIIAGHNAGYADAYQPAYDTASATCDDAD